MRVFFSTENEYSGRQVLYYSIRIGNITEPTEFEKFCSNPFPNHQLEFQILKKQLKEMGLRGAKPYYLSKDESGAYAIPIVDPEIQKSNKIDFGIRLYFQYPHFNFIILLNGGVKTQQNPTNCPNVSSHFSLAKLFHKKITNAIENDFIRFSTEIEIDDDYEFEL